MWHVSDSPSLGKGGVLETHPVPRMYNTYMYSDEDEGVIGRHLPSKVIIEVKRERSQK